MAGNLANPEKNVADKQRVSRLFPKTKCFSAQ